MSCPIYSELYPSAEGPPVINGIQTKREELVNRKNVLAEAHKLLGDQRDEASEADCQADVTSLYCLLYSHVDFSCLLSQQPANFRGRG